MGPGVKHVPAKWPTLLCPYPAGRLGGTGGLGGCVQNLQEGLLCLTQICPQVCVGSEGPQASLVAWEGLPLLAIGGTSAQMPRAPRLLISGSLFPLLALPTFPDSSHVYYFTQFSF